MPASMHTGFQGTAQRFKARWPTRLLILAAIVTVYIVLGVLYESYIHPDHDSFDAALGGRGRNPRAAASSTTDFSVIALIGIILLIGIVKKNAIMMIDFALEAERKEGKTPEDAIYEACLLRFRPIMMTTMAALFGAVPLASARHGLGTAASAGRHHHRRTADQPGADPVHHAGGLPVV